MHFVVYFASSSLGYCCIICEFYSKSLKIHDVVEVCQHVSISFVRLGFDDLKFSRGSRSAILDYSKQKYFARSVNEMQRPPVFVEFDVKNLNSAGFKHFAAVYLCRGFGDIELDIAVLFRAKPYAALGKSWLRMVCVPDKSGEKDGD